MIIKLVIAACLSWRCDAYVPETWEPVDGYGVAEALAECQDQRDAIRELRRSLGRSTNISDVYCNVVPK